jgi:uncharacterized protein YndB with AHSA1/START domain
MNEDRIEKQITLKSTKERVWHALSHSKEFGHWFGMKLEGDFAAGAHIKGSMTPTAVDPEIAEHQKDFDGCPVELFIEQVEPQTLLSFRWHPLANTADTDISNEPTTLVAFTLEEVEDGILLRVTESGFNGIPVERRAKAFGSHEQGWGIIVQLLAKHLDCVEA